MVKSMIEKNQANDIVGKLFYKLRTKLEKIVKVLIKKKASLNMHSIALLRKKKNETASQKIKKGQTLDKVD
jgi:uncharacterized protein YehS (DUF1456 family)